MTTRRGRGRTLPPTILGIESSCDETAAAVVTGPTGVLSNVVASQHDLHARYAGVVPEIASRAHVERIVPVVEEALRQADRRLSDLDAIAVGHRPGLIGSLLVGVSAAKTLAWALDRPLVGIDHVHAHLHGVFLSPPGGASAPVPAAAFPALGLVVSGGHTSLFLVHEPLVLERLGRTIDDAVGEAYDKTATLLHLGYPGGPFLDRLAGEGDDRAHDFPVAALGPDRLDFSFSGLKTAVLYAVRGRPVSGGGAWERDASGLSPAAVADFAASFQRAAITALRRTVGRALDRHPEVRTLIVGGGVSANSRLRREMTALAGDRSIDLRLPDPAYCIDNAAMIAGLAACRFERGTFDDLTLSAHSRSAT